jgi:HD-like signal output (HDOD) protein/CheY-like chemotaxis protein
MKKRILLVDGITAALHEIKDDLVSQCAEWEWIYVGTGVGALDMVSRSHYDAIVVDLRLPDLSGTHLITQVMKQNPRIYRVLLADLGDPQSLLRCVGNVHQFLAKPCDAERLYVVLQRAFEFELWLPNQTVRDLIGRIPKLPSPPTQYARVVRELQSDFVSEDKTAELIANDPAMTAKVLQLANSAAYGPPLDEADPVLAIKEIGLANTRGLILLAHTYSGFRELEGSGFSVDQLWSHSQRTGRFARWIAEAEGADGPVVQQAATAGLLHDIGKVALAANLPSAFCEVQELMHSTNVTAWEAEQKIFGATHSEVGGCLLSIWGLPPPVVEAVALHHHPTRFLSHSFSPLTAVHVANGFQYVSDSRKADEFLDNAYLAALGLGGRLREWWDYCSAKENAKPVDVPVQSNS